MPRTITPRLGLLAFGHLTIDSYSSFFSPLLPLLVHKLHLSLTLVGTLVALSSITSSFSQPLFGLISRLAEQKGFDLIEAAADRIFSLPARWVLLGSGSKRYEELFQSLEKRHPERLKFRKGFDDPLAHRIEAGADFFLMPSRYEPSGLNQMMSMRYGTVPVVRWTGGLADTVDPHAPGSEGGTGIVFEPYTPEALLGAIEAAVKLYAEPRTLQRVRRNGMGRDFSWEASARKYLQLYRQANASRRMGTGYHKWLTTVQETGPGRP